MTHLKENSAMGKAVGTSVFQWMLVPSCVFALSGCSMCRAQDAGDREVQVASGDSLRSENWQVDYLDGEPQDDWLAWIANNKKGSKSGSSSWWPSWGSSKKKASSSPTIRSYNTNNKTTYQKMTQSAKNTWKKTTDFLDPYPDPKPKSVVAPTKKKSSWFGSSEESGSWWGKEEKKKQSVPDFLGQEMPR